MMLPSVDQWLRVALVILLIKCTNKVYGITIDRIVTTPLLPWVSVASDASGERIFAAARSSADLYQYENNTDRFEPISTLPPAVSGGNRTWLSVDCDESGQYVIASCENSSLFISTDFGTSFEEMVDLPVADWHGAAFTNSSTAYAVAAGVGVFSSDTNLSNWSLTPAPNADYTSVATDKNGRYVLTASASFLSFEFGIFFSSDYATSWTILDSEVGLPTSTGFDSVAIAANTLDTITCYLPGAVYISRADGIDKWKKRNPTNNDLNLISVASNNDGTVIAAAALLDDIYGSYDLGKNWWSVSEVLGDSSTLLWRSLAISADGKQLVAAAESKGIYFIDTTPMPSSSPTFGPFDVIDISSDDDNGNGGGSSRGSVGQIMTVIILCCLAILIVAIIVYRRYKVSRGDWSENPFGAVPAQAILVSNNEDNNLLEDNNNNVVVVLEEENACGAFYNSSNKASSTIDPTDLEIQLHQAGTQSEHIVTVEAVEI